MSLKDNTIQIKINNKYEDLDFYIDIANEKNIKINKLEKFSDMFLYKIFQVCELVGIKYENLEFRQRINVLTEGDKDFDINVNSGSISSFKG